MIKLATIILISLIFSGCTSTINRELKSPCVAIEPLNENENSPCVRRSVNAHWLS